MAEAVKARILRPDRTVEVGTIYASVEPPWRIALEMRDMEHHEFEGADLFEALVKLRRELEMGGSRILCAGSRVDVFPSGMSRSMGGGRRAYVTRLGAPATQAVDILDSAEPESVGTIEEQRGFHAAWVASLSSQEARERPLQEEVEEAKRSPNGWVYRIAGRFSVAEAVPPEAIVGAWRVDADGGIVGTFVKNPNYDPVKWPTRQRPD